MGEDKRRIIEKRKYVRLPLAKDTSCKIVGHVEGTLEVLGCNDICPEGLGVTLNKSLKKGTVINIEIGMKARKPFSIKGEVVWVQEISGGAKKGQPKFRTGVKIVDIRGDRDQFLLQLCDEMVKKLDSKLPKT